MLIDFEVLSIEEILTVILDKDNLLYYVNHGMELLYGDKDFLDSLTNLNNVN